MTHDDWDLAAQGEELIAVGFVQFVGQFEGLDVVAQDGFECLDLCSAVDGFMDDWRVLRQRQRFFGSEAARPVPNPPVNGL